MTAPAPDFDLRGRVIVVTGGGGQLGKAFSASLLAQGARVAVFDQNVGEALSDGVLGCRVDVTDRKQIAEATARVTKEWGVPHGLINAAALDSSPDAPASENGPFESYPAESWDRVMAVNAKGVFLTCQVVGGAMADAGRGSIVNVGSIYGMLSPDQSLYEYRRQRGEIFFKPVAYSASKSAIYNLTRYLAVYWAKRGVRVNTVTFAGVFNNQDRDFLDGYLKKVPLGRMANADDYTGPISFLLSDSARYMTGSELVVDGGFSAW